MRLGKVTSASQQFNRVGREAPALSACSVRTVGRRVVVRVRQNPFYVETLQEKDSCACSHFQALRHPDTITDIRLLQDDVRAALHAGHE
jgi:hypothetical protein